MSEKIQRRARDRRDAARERADNARTRAQRQRDEDDTFMARLHEDSATLQDAAAKAAERLRAADAVIEGDQLDTP